jgi:D-alanyl-D-alanine carboxypeptidase
MRPAARLPLVGGGLRLRRALVVGALALAGLSSCARHGPPLAAKLQSALDDRLRRCDAKGASAAVVLPDGTVWRGVSGNSHDGVPMAPDMAFAIGSITKNMVATLTLQLAEEGRLSLEDPVGKWVPAHPHVDPAVTIRQMLDHTSGLFMFWDNPKLWEDLVRDRTRVFTPEDVLGYLREPHFAPGRGYRYSNTNYLLAAMVLTRATGSTLSAELRRRLWEPLGLRSARLPPEEPYPENLAHVWGDNFENDGSDRDVTFLPRTSHDTITYGSAGVFMTAEDLARWTHALFHGKVVSQASLAQMQTFSRWEEYGLGLGRLGREVVGGLKAVGHGGGNIGTTAYMAYLPDHDVSIAVTVNRFGGPCAARIVRGIATTAVWHLDPGSFFALWGLEVLLAGLWLAAGTGALAYAIRRDKPLVLLLFGSLAIAAGRISADRGIPLDFVLLPWGAAIAAAGLGVLLRRFSRRRGA